MLAKREPTKNETWLINALERLKEVFLKHEKVNYLVSSASIMLNGFFSGYRTISADSGRVAVY